jgi:hypothetical protein
MEQFHVMQKILLVNKNPRVYIKLLLQVKRESHFLFYFIFKQHHILYTQHITYIQNPAHRKKKRMFCIFYRINILLCVKLRFFSLLIISKNYSAFLMKFSLSLSLMILFLHYGIQVGLSHCKIVQCQINRSKRYMLNVPRDMTVACHKCFCWKWLKCRR